jgi:CheY-like chemotaxis protein
MQARPDPEADTSSDHPGEPATSAAVRRFLLSHGVREHNHASEIARIINVDRSQSYRRLKGDVAWSHTDLRTIARHFDAAPDHLLPREETARSPVADNGQACRTVAAAIRVPHLPPNGALVPGAELGVDDRCELVAVKLAHGWEIWVDGDEPAGARRHAVDTLVVRCQPLLQVALLEDDARAAEALVEAFRPLGIIATPFADGPSLLRAMAQRGFDAYVLDWLLHEGTAATVVEQIRAHRPHIPIVVVTGALAGDADMEQSLLDLSARWNFSTLDKPVRPMNLANALKQLVNVARA